MDDLSRFDDLINRAKENKKPKPDIKQVYKEFEAYKKQAAEKTEKPSKTKKPKQPQEDFLK